MVSRAASGLLRVRYDAARDIVHVFGTGIWSVAQMDRHFAFLHTLYPRIRRERGRVRTLGDIRDVRQQPYDVALRIGREAGELYEVGDRLAIVARSELARLQVTELGRLSTTEVFCSIDTAERWLLAHEAARPRPELSLEWANASASH